MPAKSKITGSVGVSDHCYEQLWVFPAQMKWPLSLSDVTVEAVNGKLSIKAIGGKDKAKL